MGVDGVQLGLGVAALARVAGVLCALSVPLSFALSLAAADAAVPLQLALAGRLPPNSARAPRVLAEPLAAEDCSGVYFRHVNPADAVAHPTAARVGLSVAGPE